MNYVPSQSISVQDLIEFLMLAAYLISLKCDLNNSVVDGNQLKFRIFLFFLIVHYHFLHLFNYTDTATTFWNSYFEKPQNCLSDLDENIHQIWRRLVKAHHLEEWYIDWGHKDGDLSALVTNSQV